jgi:acetoacetate decarboxylase
MKADDVRRTAFAMPCNSPSYPPGPYRFVGREFLTITYRTDPDALRRVVPAPLEIIDPLVRMEFIGIPDSTGFGAYHGAAQVIPVGFKGETGGYTRLMFLDAHPPISGGRELWGFPQKLAGPMLRVETDTLVGTLNVGPVRVATGTMGYKHRTLAADAAAAGLAAPGFLLKIMPHVDGTPRICELVRHTKEDLVVTGAWSGPVALDLHPHALAPLADLPILEITGGTHVIADYTLALGAVVHDYLG